MPTWSGVTGKLRGVMAISAILIAVAVGATVGPFMVAEAVEDPEDPANQNLEKRQEPATNSDNDFLRQWESESDMLWAKMVENARQKAKQSNQNTKDLSSQMESSSPQAPKQVRKVRRYEWESPSETRSKLWNVPTEESEIAEMIGLLRICTSEQEGSRDDCVGIWQVLNTIRSRSCNRHKIRRITECNEDDQETMLSVMRRVNRYVLGVVEPKRRRQRWISRMDLSCERPENFPHSDKIWNKRHLHHCKNTVKLVQQLVQGEQVKRITNAQVIAWGGRCEVPRGACDDRIACARGLARVPGLDTHNAFWCRPSTKNCPKDIDPICIKMGYPSLFHTDSWVQRQSNQRRRRSPRR